MLLLSINAFLAASGIIVLLARLSQGQSSSYIVQYRSPLGLNAIKSGGVSELLSFIPFILLVAMVQVLLSIRTYKLNRSLSIAMLSLGILLLTISVIISNVLLENS